MTKSEEKKQMRRMIRALERELPLPIRRKAAPALQDTC